MADYEEWDIEFRLNGELVPKEEHLEKPFNQILATTGRRVVTVIGFDSEACQRRVIKLDGSSGPVDNMLKVRLGDVWVHIRKDLIIVCEKQLTTGLLKGLGELEPKEGEE